LAEAEQTLSAEDDCTCQLICTPCPISVAQPDCMPNTDVGSGLPPTSGTATINLYQTGAAVAQG